ncbi:AAA family ATPase [Pseudoduganella umbonata]|uniref:ATPase n=1 Tax=Pseudoduganella umbonata TaxID=864828 RepID=A0A4P8HWE9_9BURK|nr:AAA family ATPase [Pseudoduganella umbonata]MBB3224469.1 putative ATP-binding protein involved in virulence [Pseudoduganella umbonata]QCP13242.1 ATPase [Pseudoduganella umbonata]
MRLESLRLKNFRSYEDREFLLHPQFNLIVGENGAGKTSVLEAASVAIGSWFLGIRGYDSRNIRPRDVRIERAMIEGRYRELKQYPVRVSATAVFHLWEAHRDAQSNLVEVVRADDCKLRWTRSVEGENGRTTQQEAKEIRKLAEDMAKRVYGRTPRILPLIRYFGAGRLWESVRDTEKSKAQRAAKLPQELENIDDVRKAQAEHAELSKPFYGYKFSVDKRCSADEIIKWIEFERRNELDDEEPSQALALVYKAILSMLPDARSVRYQLKQKSLLIELKDWRMLRFDELSDGYRNVLALAADLAIKAAMLNPQLADRALELTPGVVLIDELDLHLHPKWQRQIVEAFRETFPMLQFICTTHSPFLIQSLRSGEELIVLDGQPVAQVNNMDIDEIAEGLMNVPETDVSPRYAQMKDTARDYLEALERAPIDDRAKLEAFKDRLAEAISPYADNPAYQALLEMKRVAKLGG